MPNRTPKTISLAKLRSLDFLASFALVFKTGCRNIDDLPLLAKDCRYDRKKTRTHRLHLQVDARGRAAIGVEVPIRAYFCSALSGDSGGIYRRTPARRRDGANTCDSAGIYSPRRHSYSKARCHTTDVFPPRRGVWAVYGRRNDR